MKLNLLSKLRDLITELEKYRRFSDYAYGQRGRNENGRIGGKRGITAPGNNPNAPRVIFPDRQHTTNEP